PRRREVERRDVDDDLPALRREDPDEVPNAGNVELAVRPAVDDVDLGAARSIDVADGSENRPIRRGHGRPDDLVPEVRAPWQGRIRAGRDLEIGVLEALGRGPITDFGELETPARSIGDRRRPGDRQGRGIALPMEDGPRRVAVLGPVGQDLDPDRAAQPVDAPDERDDQAVVSRCRGLGHRFPQRISSEIGSPSRAAVTLRSVRSAFATLPFRPITLPMSSSATWSSMTVPPWSRTTSTLTASGSSTRDLATYSTSSAAAIGRAPTWWR